MRIFVGLPLAVCLVSSMIAGLQAQVPDTISFQGVLTHPDGTPIDTTESMSVRLYKNGVIVWDNKIAGVEVVNGGFSMPIGGNARFDTVAFNKPMELEIKLGTAAEPWFSPRIPLQSVPYALGLRGLQVIPAANSNDAPDLIGGYLGNTGPREGGTIGGGGENTATNDVTGRYGTIAGGLGNSAAEQASVGGGGGNNATGKFASIGGGALNTASGQNATVAGGLFNSAAEGSAVGGGNGNSANGRFATIGGGVGNNVFAKYGTIAGGGPSDSTDATNTNNRVYDMYGTIGGGGSNRVGSNDGLPNSASSATVAGGSNNWAGAEDATVAGGAHNLAFAEGATVAGGRHNISSGEGATVAGGTSNIGLGFESVVGGGNNNQATGFESTVAGGLSNAATGDYSAVSGGAWNRAWANYATIGGGGSTDTTDSLSTEGTSNKVFDDYGTIGGGGRNKVGIETDGSTNQTFSTVGGGRGNTASGKTATIGGGETNTASGLASTVGGGYSNQATGQDSWVGGGALNEAFGRASMIPGGVENAATGYSSFAAGRSAASDHDYTFVWNDRLAGFSSTGIQQFLIRAGGGVGINTNAPASQLHVKDSLNLTGTSLSAYVASIENTSSGTSADGLAIKVGTTGNPGSAVNFVGFFDGDTGLIGQIEGNGAGGVAYNTTGADYAEYLPRLDHGETINPGNIVGVFGGSVSKSTTGSQRVMVVTDRPAVIGNMPAGEDDPKGYEKVSFVGQVPASVTGPVFIGDYIVPSGNNDGVGVAVRPDMLQAAHTDQIVGRAWQSSSELGPKRVIIEVGLDRSAAMSSLLHKQQAEINLLRSRLASIEARLGSE